MSKYAIFFIFSLFYFAGNANARNIDYKLSLEVNGKLVSSDSFVNRKPSNSSLPDVIAASFNSDEITLKIEFRLSAKANANFKQYTCSLGLQTQSGYEIFNFENASKSIVVPTFTNDGTYLCKFENITQYSNVEHKVSSILRNQTFLFEIWVNELGKNWTYLGIIAKEATDWPNKSMQPTAKASAD